MSNPIFDQALHTLLKAVVPHIIKVTEKGKETIEWKECVIHARFQCEQPTVDMVLKNTVTSDTKDGNDKNKKDKDEKEEDDDDMDSIIVIPDFETSHGIMTAIKAMWSQMNGPSMGAPWGAIRFFINTDFRMTMKFDAVEHTKEEEKEVNDQFADQVYKERRTLFEKLLCGDKNTEPDLITKMNNLFGVWPLGGLCSFHNPTTGTYFWTTFGLTNPDMPASMMSKQVGPMGSMLMPKAQAPFPRVGMAGYGYEIIIMIDEKDTTWPRNTLSWACNNELLGDINFLAHVEAMKGLTAGDVPGKDGEKVNILIAPPYVEEGKDENSAVIPLTGELPNGRMKFLILTIITDEEVEYSMENDRQALLKMLYRNGEGQLSRLNRKSVV